MEYTAEQAVEAGVVLLDEFVPGWAEYIDWDKLDIYSLDMCIIGQLNDALISEDSIDDIFDRIGLYGFFGGKRYGFEIVTEWYGYDALTTAWQNWRKALA